MKNIMCFGDSNTYGVNPKIYSRFDINSRWPWLLGQMLGEEYHIIEEGLCGRTISQDDIGLYNMNGKKQIQVLMHSHHPLDLIIIMLGTNDLKPRFNLTAKEIASTLGDLVTTIRNYKIPFGKAPEILLVAPTNVVSSKITCDYFGDQDQKSRDLTPCFKEIADAYGVHFLSILDLVSPSPFDGLHLDIDSQPIVAEAMFKKVREILG